MYICAIFAWAVVTFAIALLAEYLEYEKLADIACSVGMASTILAMLAYVVSSVANSANASRPALPIPNAVSRANRKPNSSRAPRTRAGCGRCAY